MKKGFLKTKVSEVNTIIDSDTGEILDISTKRHTYLANSKEEFFICYASIVGIFMNITQAEARVFGYCLRYRNAKFDISKKVRVSMSNEVDLNERTILNTIPTLIEKGLLFKTEDSLYGINPRYVFHGSTKDRDAALKAVIELGCKDC